MAVGSDEEEQIEAVKNWLDQNGTSLAITILIAVGGVFGYQTWDKSTREYAESASAVYQELREAVEVSPTGTLALGGGLNDEQRATARYLAGQLKSEYEDTTYAVFASLHLARNAADDRDWDAARSELTWALDRAEGGIKLIARLRLARVMLQQDEADAALKLLYGVEAGSLLSSVEEVRGDILAKLGRSDDARAAYQRAFETQVEGVQKPFLKMKLDDLAPVTDAVAETADQEAS